MKNPLRKRFFRGLRSGAGQYIAMFVMLILIIGLCSGYLVAGDSLMKAYRESFDKYNVEDGNFTVSHRLNRSTIKDIEEFGVRVFPLFFYDREAEDGNTLRIFEMRQEVNGACLMEGRLPEAPDEIAVDRMYADNNGIRVGDRTCPGGKEFTVTGLIALSDYSTMFRNNNDSMFDAKRFGVSVVTEEAFSSFSDEDPVWRYAWTYNDPPADTDAEVDMAEDFTDHLHECTPIRECIPQYLNQAIVFTGTDFGSDRQMMITVLYIVIVIITFVFMITTNNTIHKEAAVIGTLRASGYTRGELIRHYMFYPLAVTIAGAVIGNIIGYTFMEGFMAGLYYGSYSLPTYETYLNAEAFVLTTAVPAVIVLFASLLVTGTKITLPPMKFLRRDLTRSRQKKALRLPAALRFFARFRARILLKNLGSYIVMIIGIFFGNVLVMFGMGFPESLDRYETYMTDHLIAEHQYILEIPDDVLYGETKLDSMIAMMKFGKGIETGNEDAEKFSVYTLKYMKDDIRSEEIMLYGIDPESRYIPLDVEEGQVYISSAFAQKYDIFPGDALELKELYDSDIYSFTVDGVYEYEGGLAVYMSQEKLNRMLDWDDDFFCGYLSDSEITDIDEEYIATEIDFDAVTVAARQLDISLGSMMGLFEAVGVIIYILLIYILSKMIIDKNAQSISMIKILGYTNGEIGKLYVTATTLVVVLALVLTIPAADAVMNVLFKGILLKMNGWFSWSFSFKLKAVTVAIGLAAYAAVALLELARIRKVPMNQALKNIE